MVWIPRRFQTRGQRRLTRGRGRNVPVSRMTRAQKARAFGRRVRRRFYRRRY